MVPCLYKVVARVKGRSGDGRKGQLLWAPPTAREDEREHEVERQRAREAMTAADLAVARLGASVGDDVAETATALGVLGAGRAGGEPGQTEPHATVRRLDLAIGGVV